MKKINYVVVLAGLILMPGCMSLSYQDQAGGIPVPKEKSIVGSVGQPTYSSLRSPIRARVLDRRFITKEAMYLATEMNQSGNPFLEQALAIGLPVAEDKDFMYMTGVESYWYSRYNMSALVTESRLGVHLVYGPYVTEKALREGAANINRERQEYTVSNKTELIQRLVPMYLSRSGFPRHFEDASPIMLPYASGDPFYIRPIDKGFNFESTENLVRARELKKLYGDAYTPPPSGMGESANDLWQYRVNYRENFLSLRWDHDKMDTTIDTGAIGQTLMKEVLWEEYFFQGSHHDGKYLGNNPEEGFRGAMLNLMSVSTMLMLKSAMLYNGDELRGFNPIGYDPAKELWYFPHQYRPRLRYIGDMPPRLEELTVKDPSSQLFDQASLLWGLTEYYYFSDPTISGNWNKVFGNNPPYDGSIMEQKYALLAHGLADMVLKNIAAMHTRDGLLVSEWQPKTKTGSKISVQDLGMAMVALANYRSRIHADSKGQELVTRLLRRQADFLIGELQNSDSSFPDGYDYGTKQKLGKNPTLLAQGFAIRGLLEAYQQLKDERYLASAKNAYHFMNEALWDNETGVYRSEVRAEKSLYTPMNLGAALGAMREMILITKDVTEIQRYKRFWVQAVNSSGIQQSEYEESGEGDLYQADADGDGIPRMEYAGGRYGIAPVYACKVEIDTPNHGSKGMARLEKGTRSP